ncbi:hypothetical protein DRE_01123 [Drechslerella stenobrocha 248]|uniref:Potassium channel domain-containing protein n=1 Tax=Drechslerella stenobrocha 248 TaxID=1043628 RepID=W7HW51_9PEZI|nr:hypothetical protein DRE_01123 [Drechslerella stenobrocha 248]
MNDPGLDDSIRELTETQKQTQAHPPPAKSREGPSSGDRFLSLPYHTLPPGLNPSHRSSAASSVKSNKETALKPPRVSCFWERFSNDSREDGDGDENTRKSRRGSRNSNSPTMEGAMTAFEPGDEEANMQELEETPKQGDSEDHLPGMHWMFGIIFPLMSATLGPVANVMSICALVIPWRDYIPPNVSGASAENGIKIHDPAWCLALNAISLACGFAANAILLLNLARRIQSTSLQPFTIALWYIASLILIALLAVYRQYLYQTPREQYAWSQAFYYSIIAASLYFVIATLLVGSYIGVLSGRYARQFTLTIAQRTLMLQTMSLMGWLCLGAGVFARLEGWAYLDGIYFCDATFLVVGLGDFTLNTNAGRALLFPYAAVGIVIVGLIVSSVRGLMLERGKKRVKRDILEKQRDRFVNGKGNHRAPADAAGTERERFDLMRKVQGRAEDRRKWVALCFSVTSFLLFWLVGACVFMEAEESQNWTYFQALYFCFTAILTIGFGDIHPTSNSAKPFFVIWSLLAVPMMTILVSNLGDTVIVLLKNVTLRVGEYTILPGEKKERLPPANAAEGNQGRQRDQDPWAPGSGNHEMEQEGRNPEDGMEDPEEVEEKLRLRRLGTGLVAQEEKDEGWYQGGPEESLVFLLHDLAFAVQQLMPDLAAKPPKQYTYEEWVGYIKLIDMPIRGLSEPYKTPTPRINAPGLDYREEVRQTDWLAEESPLMSREGETEWLLTRLCSKLEQCLRVQKLDARRRDKGKSRREDAHAGKSMEE